jgi:hypothetical protein
MASAATWKLGTHAKSQGGTITSSNMTGQTVANGAIYRTYSTTNGGPVTVTPASGWKISKLEKNGIVSGPYTMPVVVDLTGSNLNVFATFARVSYVLSAPAGAGGTVDKAGISPVYAGLQSPLKSFIFTPTPTTNVQSIGASAGTLNVDYQIVNAVTGLPMALPAANGVKVKVNVANIPNTNISFSATFGGAIAAPTLGKYSTAGPAAAATNQCINCHNTVGVGAGVYQNWSSSVHNNGVILCYNCHIGTNTGGHPGSPECNYCHATGANDAPVATKHDLSLLSPNVCADCHSASGDVHSISAGYTPTSGSDTEVSCLACYAIN